MRQFLLYIFAKIVFVIAKTWEIKAVNSPDFNSGIVAFWHGQMLPVWYYFAKQNNKSALVSSSKDGEALCAILTLWNYNLIRGSSSKGGSEALEELTIFAKQGIVLITPDGPRGPIYKMKPGALVAASRARVPLFLAQVKIHSKWIFKKSWDKFQFPKPFSTIEIIFSEIDVPNNNQDRDAISFAIKNAENVLINGVKL